MPYLSVFVTSPDTHSERRFDSGLTAQQLKVKTHLLFHIRGVAAIHF